MDVINIAIEVVVVVVVGLLTDNFARDDDPAKSNQDANPCADAEGSCSTNLGEDRSPNESAGEERDGGNKPVVARFDLLTEVEQARVREELHPDRRQHNGGTELRVEALPDDALHAEARAHEREAGKREGVRPAGVAALGGDAALAALPQRERGGHGEEHLEERGADEPGALVRANTVAEAADEGSRHEGQQRRESLSIGDVEG